MGNGYIYIIECSHSDKVYIGSTTTCIYVRFYQHLYNKQSTSSKALTLHGPGRCSVRELARVNYVDIQHLRALEQLYINKFKNKTCNKRPAFDPLKKCHHHKNRVDCVACMGRFICEHFKRRRECVTCKRLNTGGLSLCVHERRRYACRICNKI